MINRVKVTARNACSAINATGNIRMTSWLSRNPRIDVLLAKP
jgi:hypothetical protein